MTIYIAYSFSPIHHSGFTQTLEAYQNKQNFDELCKQVDYDTAKSKYDDNFIEYNIVKNFYELFQKVGDKYDDITHLECKYNVIDEFPKLPKSLLHFDCTGSSFVKFPKLPSGLLSLICSKCKYANIRTLKLPTGLIECDISMNDVNVIYDLPKSLKILNISMCSIENIQSLKSLKNLEEFYCMGCELISLPSLPNSLKVLKCNNNELTKLDNLPCGLEILNAKYNKLTEFINFPPNLKNVDLRNNMITQLVYPPKIEVLFIGNNRLEYIKTPPNTITKFHFCNNPLKVPVLIPETYIIYRNIFEMKYLTGRYILSDGSSPHKSYDMECKLFDDKRSYENMSDEEYQNIINNLKAFEENNIDSNLKEGLIQTTMCDNSWSWIFGFRLAFETFDEVIAFYGIWYDDIKEIYCNGCNLNELPTMPKKLEKLFCCRNNLVDLPPMPSLKNLYCSDNKFISMPQLPDGLVTYSGETGDGIIENLPKSLESLSISGPIDYIQDLTELTNLHFLQVNDCGLTDMPGLPDSLEFLICSDNMLTELINLPSGLEKLYARNNSIGELNVPENIKSLDIFENQLTSLPTIPATVKHLAFGNNPYANPILVPETEVIVNHFHHLEYNTGKYILSCGNESDTPKELLNKIYKMDGDCMDDDCMEE